MDIALIISIMVALWILFFIWGFLMTGVRTANRQSQANFEKSPVVLATTKVEHPEHRGSLQGYPVYTTLLKIIETWNPDVPDPPATFVESLQHFNYSDPHERQMAEIYREAEVPFKIYDIPEVDAVSSKWTEDYLINNLEYHNNHIELSKDNHFMFFNGNSRGVGTHYTPPQKIIRMKYGEWLKMAKEADRTKLSNRSEHIYFTTGSMAGDRTSSFIARDLNIFSTRKENFFITSVPSNKGIQCRFGMRGVIAESHYDSGKNMVAMIRGAKRYILTPPSTCKQLGIIADTNHPSYRHSVIDWSDVEQARSRGFGSVPAIDTIVRQGEILYIPSYWFHYIVSLEYSIQCNSRSGAPPRGEGQQDIEECMGKKIRPNRHLRKSLFGKEK